MKAFVVRSVLALVPLLVVTNGGLAAQVGGESTVVGTVDSVNIAVVVDGFHAALRSGDEAGVRALLLPDARILEGSNIETAEEYMSGHMAGDMAFAAGLNRQIISREVFQPGPDVAWAVTRSHSVGESRGREIDRMGAELMVLRKVDGSWRIAAIQWS